MAIENERERIRCAFPKLSLIEDETLRAKIIDIWVEAWRSSNWEDLEVCPFNPEFPDLSLVGHVNCLADLLPAAVEILGRHYPEVALDNNRLLAGVFLHDISKILEIEPGPDGTPQFTELTRQMPHAVYGAFLALKADLPLDLVNMILAHTRHTGAKPVTGEAVLLHYLDYMLADVLRFGRSLDLIMEGKSRYGR